MSRRPEIPQSRRHVIIFDEDWDFLLDHYGPHSDSRHSAGWAIRQLVHKGVLQLRASAQALADQRPAAAEEEMETAE